MRQPKVHALALYLVTLVASLGMPWGGAAVAHAGKPPRLFSPHSVWNSPLPRRARIDPTSAARVGALADDIERKMQRRMYPNIAGRAYGTTLYVVRRHQRRVHVVLDTGSWRLPLEHALRTGVPIPARAHPAKGTDGQMVIYQPSTDTLWEFWRAVRRRDGWHASWGGAMRHVSRSPGYYTRASWPGLGPLQGSNWGATATSLSVAGGLMKMAELRRGRIRHALAVAIPRSCKAAFTWPAQRHDGRDRSANCMPEGARLRLDPRIDVSRLHLPRITRMIARAAQRYGMIVRDTTKNQSFSLFAEAQRDRGPSPYLGRHNLFGGVPGWRTMLHFPWRRLELMRMRLCTRRPCPPPR